MKRYEIKLDSQGLLLLIKLKIFDNDDKATKHSERKRTFCGLVIIIKNFDFTSSRRPWRPIRFHVFSSWPFLGLDATSFTPGVFWLRFHFFFRKLY